MTTPADEPPGIGTPPSTGHPSFQQGWAAPLPGTRVGPAAHGRAVDVAPPPTGRRPRRRPRRRVVLGAALASGLLLVGVLRMLPLAGTPLTGTGPAVVTASPSPTGTAVTPVSGGDLGRAVAFTGARGSGTVTVNRAVWTDSGDLAAPSGERYLVLDVTVTCLRGQVPVGPVEFVLASGTSRHGPAFGERLATPLAGASLAPGETASGQLGFAVPPAAATLELQDENLRTLASVAIPGP